MHTESKKYLSLFAKIPLTNSLHVVIYNSESWKIPGKTVKELASQSLVLPKNGKAVKFIIESDDGKYVKYAGNQHHWTTTYCWREVLPTIFEHLGLQFDESLFQKINFIWNDCDFSYHQPIQEMKFEVEDFVTKNKISGSYDVLRNINLCPKTLHSYSLYHMLFRLAHTSGIIKNISTKSTSRLAVNCDSMAIPIVPILAPFFKETLVIDKRTKNNPKYWQKLLAFKPTHYLALFTEYNFLIAHKHCKNLFDQI